MTVPANRLDDAAALLACMCLHSAGTTPPPWDDLAPVARNQWRGWMTQLLEISGVGAQVELEPIVPPVRLHVLR